MGYVIYDAFTSDSNPEIANIVASNFVNPKIQKQETFDLLEIEKDPFLGTLYKKSSQTSRSSTTNISNKEIKWPAIIYQGIVSGGTSAIYMVSINGQQHLLSKNEVVESIKVIKGSREMITLKYEGQTKQFSIM